MKVKVEGLRELESSLAELTRAGAAGVLRRTARQALGPVASAARNMAPVEFGDLRDSIIVSDRLAKGKRSAGKAAFAETLRAGGSKEQARAALIAANRAAKSGALSIEMHAGPGQHPQAITQEFGTGFHPPQPFMRPAWDANKGAVLTEVKRALGAEIDKAAARAARKALRAAAKAGG